MPRPLYVIAEDIRTNWSKVSPYAVPYLEAMESLSSTNDTYGADDADGIVRYFLSNAQGWHGNEARRIKAELREMIK